MNGGYERAELVINLLLKSVAMWRVGWIDGFKRRRMAANITFQAAPTEDLDVERYFSVFAGRDRQFTSQPIKFSVVRCGL